MVSEAERPIVWPSRMPLTDSDSWTIEESTASWRCLSLAADLDDRCILVSEPQSTQQAGISFRFAARLGVSGAIDTASIQLLG